MNTRIITLLICILFAASGAWGRRVSSFCEGWEFKKGSFPADAMKNARKWNSGWELKFGEENEIVVKADNSARPDAIPVNHVLFGVYGGIYRPVWLIATERSTSKAIRKNMAAGDAPGVREALFVKKNKKSCE